MNLEHSEADAEFQSEVRAFLAANLPGHLQRAAKRSTTALTPKEPALEWQRILAAKGWAAPWWPPEWGGTGWTATQKFIFTAECFRAEAPELSPFGLRMLAPVLFRYGTDDQKQRYLPPILSGEHFWCQGYSEPGAGSDLASLKLRAERRSDHYLINGSKIWQTQAHEADHIFFLARTDTSVKPQAGISFLLAEINQPGISVEPIVSMSLEHEVNQVFFDDVEVAVENRVGDEGQGWECAKHLLEFERGGIMSAQFLAGKLDRLEQLVAVIKHQDPTFSANDHVTQELSRIAIDIKALEMTELGILDALTKGGNPGVQTSTVKLSKVDIEQRIQQLAVDAVGYDAVNLGKDSSFGEDVECLVPAYLNGRASSIYGGSREIQLNILAKSLLRGARP